MKIDFILNGERTDAEVDPSMRLIDLLRETFRLTSVKEGCGAGECGACTVLLDGDPVCSCLVPAVQARGHEVLTVDGLTGTDGNGTLSVIQQAFLDCDAIQCGFCTPGMVLTAHALLAKNPAPTDAEIRSALAGNICRCTGYVPILNAVRTAAGRLSEREEA